MEALKRVKAEIDKKRQGKAPNIMEDPAAALQFQKQLADAEYLETHMARRITARLKQMTPEQQDAFYDSCISEERKNAYVGAASAPCRLTGLRSAEHPITKNKGAAVCRRRH